MKTFLRTLKDRKTMKQSIVLLLIFSLVFSIAFALFAKIDIVKADVSLEDLYVQYTDSDVMVNDTRTIQWYANNYTNSNNFSLITKIIPEQCLKTNGTYFYMGKEYGFCAKTYSSFSDIIVIDFDVNYMEKAGSNLNSDLEMWYTVRPVFQFRINKTVSGSNILLSLSTQKSPFLLENINFVSMVSNENALNFGDNGYNKRNDEGAIFLQSRMNYNMVTCYVEEGDWVDAAFIAMDVAYFAAAIAFPPAAAGLGLVSFLGNYAFDTSSLLYEVSQPNYSLANNEFNISTNMSRQSQWASSSQGYTKTIVLSNGNEKIAIGKENDEYVQFITMIDDTGERTRFETGLQFNITYDGEAIVNGNEDNIFAFTDTTVRFDVISVIDGSTDFYLLSQGDQFFSFTPKYSGHYSFSSSASYGIYYQIFNNSMNPLSSKIQNEITFFMNQDVTYKIQLTSAQKRNGIMGLDIPYYNNQNVTLQKQNAYITKYKFTTSDVRKFTASNSNMKMKVLDNNQSELEYSLDNIVFSNIVANVDYYVLVQNPKTTANSFTIASVANGATAISMNAISEVNISNVRSVFYKFTVSTTGKYDVNFAGIEKLSTDAKIFKSGSMDSVVVAEGVQEVFKTFRTNGSLSTGTYFLRLRNEDSSTSFSFDLSINAAATSYQWRIDGVPFVSGMGITRGVRHSIEVYSNSVKQNKMIWQNATYKDLIDFEYENGKIYFTVKNNSKMYNDQLEYFATFFLVADQLTFIDIPIVYEKQITFSGVAANEFANYAKLTWNTVINNSGETVKMYYKYTLNGSSESKEGSVNVTNITSLNLKTLLAYDDKATYLDFTVQSFHFFNAAGAETGRVYNSAVSGNTSKINKVNIPTLRIWTLFDSGTGTSSDPYIIKDFFHFNNIGNTINSSGKIASHFKLASNINYWGANQGNVCNGELTGTIDGNNYTISGYSPSSLLSDGNSGIISSIGAGGVFKNFKFTMSSIYDIGIASNKMMSFMTPTNKGLIENCDFTYTPRSGTSTATAQYVGLVGQNTGTIKNVKVAGTMRGGSYMGSIAAHNSGTIESCEFKSGSYLYYNVKYTNNDKIGGIVGYNASTGKINNCKTYGRIIVNLAKTSSTSLQPYVGGVMGENLGTYNNNSYVQENIDNGQLYTVKHGFLNLSSHNQAKYATKAAIGKIG